MLAPAPGIDTRIARQVRCLREEQGLTLDALAARSGVSRSMLSLIERGESSATAVVLEKVATGLGAPLAVLFDDAAAAPDPVSRAADRAPWRDPASGYIRCNVSPPNAGSPISIVEVELPGGAQVAYESGPREPLVHQQIWVQEGAVEVTVERSVYRLREGDCLAVRLDVPTAFRNRGRRRARYVVVLCSERGATRARR